MGHVILIEIFIPPYLWATVLKYPSKQLFFDAFGNLSFFLPFPSFLTMQLEPPKTMCTGTLSGRVIEHSSPKWPGAGLNPGWRFADRQLRRSTPEPFFILDPGSNPSNHKLLTPPPPNPPTPPPKNGIQFQGDRGLKIKKSIWGIVLLGKRMIL